MKKNYNDIGGIIIGIILVFFLVIAFEILLPFISRIKLDANTDGDAIGILGVLLTFISIFGGGVYYIIYQINKRSLDKIRENIKESMHNERYASKAEMHLSTSNIFSKLYELTLKIEKEDAVERCKVAKDGQCQSCKVFNVFKANNFLDSAIMHDELATSSLKKIKGLDEYRDLYLKVLNNRGYNIYLKYKRLVEILKDGPVKEKDEVSDEEILRSLSAKNELQKSIFNEDRYIYEDITYYHIKAWTDTCKKIDILTDLDPRWGKLRKTFEK